jgi:hypothetical protein
VHSRSCGPVAVLRGALFRARLADARASAPKQTVATVAEERRRLVCLGKTQPCAQQLARCLCCVQCVRIPHPVLTRCSRSRKGVQHEELRQDRPQHRADERRVGRRVVDDALEQRHGAQDLSCRGDDRATCELLGRLKYAVRVLTHCLVQKRRRKALKCKDACLCLPRRHERGDHRLFGRRLRRHSRQTRQELREDNLQKCLRRASTARNL